MKVIILAGGRATRLPESAKDTPKVLVKAGGRPILAHLLDLLKKHGLSDIRLSLGYLAEQIIDYLGGQYEYVVEPKPLGTGGAIKFASQDMDKHFMVLQGDNIWSGFNLNDFINFYQKTGLLGAIAVKFHKDLKDYGAVEIEDDKIKKFIEKSTEIKSGFGNTGCWIFSPDIFRNIDKEEFSAEYDVFPDLAQKGQLAGYVHKGFWMDLGTEKRLAEVRKKLGG